MKIKKNDTVHIIAGKDRGKQGKVLRAFPELNTVLVDGVNIQKRHIKKKKSTAQGMGIVERPAPVHVSNVQIVDPKTGKPKSNLAQFSN
jgi:large subunit ribosomal protein L24